jgi:hypothetical protein
LSIRAISHLRFAADALFLTAGDRGQTSHGGAIRGLGVWLGKRIRKRRRGFRGARIRRDWGNRRAGLDVDVSLRT